MAAHDIPSPEASINTDAALKPGQYKVIRADGAESVHVGNPSIRAIQLLIGCDTLDTVTIDRRRQTVMFVDDVGMLDGKLVNAKATVADCKSVVSDNCHVLFDLSMFRGFGVSSFWPVFCHKPMSRRIAPTHDTRT
jgi:hypothetical protein